MTITKAIARFRQNQEYEDRYPRLTETLKRLGKIQRSAQRLRSELEQLSPMGRACLYELDTSVELRSRLLSENGSEPLRGPTSRRDRNLAAEMIGELKDLAQICEPAQAHLVALCELEKETGQGAGSGMGRTSDLWALPIGDTELKTLQFRSPKDKFAVAVIVALATEDIETRTSRWSGKRVLEQKLDQICAAESLGSGYSWHRITRDRKAIKGMALRDIENRAHWDEAMASTADDAPPEGQGDLT